MKYSYKKINYLFSLFVFLLAFTTISNSLLLGEGIRIRAVIFVGSAFLFFVSSFLDKKRCLYINALHIYAHAIYSLFPGHRNSAFGILMMVLSAIILFATGFYIKYGISKIIVIWMLNLLALYFGPLFGVVDSLIIAIQWNLFILVTCLILRLLFYEEISIIRDCEQKIEKKYIKIIDDATSVAREAIDLLKMLKDESNGK